MADVTLTISPIPDSKIALVKALTEKYYFNGEVQTAAVIKGFWEADLTEYIIQRLERLHEMSQDEQRTKLNPLTP